ncbi:MAG: hemolysin III family protein [Yaniella sp.]|nr:hemolysin III family protein [Yaniella sp.]
MTSHEAADSVNDVQQDSVPAVVQKPLLRGWIHLIATPVALIAGLIAVAQPAELYDRLSVAVFVLCSVVLFGASAVYHLGNWEPTRRAILRRIDHSNIYLLIAGTYTPLAVLLLEPDTRALLLGIIWPGAFLGIAVRQFWISAPRWIYVPIYVVLGWVAIWFLPDIYHAGGSAVVWFVVLGGLMYTAGALMYALKRPNWFRYTFGFHEAFHVCTVIGWALHFLAIVASW